MPNENAAPALSEVDELHKRILVILTQSCEKQDTCKACGARIFFVYMKKSGRLAPFTAEGINHFIDCPAAKEFKRQ